MGWGVWVFPTAVGYSLSGSTMSPLDVLPLWLLKWSTIGLICVLPWSVCNACYVNDCICLNAEIICQNVDQAAPIFTAAERFAVNHLYISAKQEPWIRRACGLFPRLIEVVMMDGTRCPKNACLPCR